MISVSRTQLGQEKSSDEKIQIRPFVTDTATVSIKFGATIPTEQYANIRVDVMVAVPCYVEEIGEVYEQTRTLVDNRMQEELSRLLKDKEQR